MPQLAILNCLPRDAHLHGTYERGLQSVSRDPQGTPKGPEKAPSGPHMGPPKDPKRPPRTLGPKTWNPRPKDQGSRSKAHDRKASTPSSHHRGAISWVWRARRNARSVNNYVARWGGSAGVVVIRRRVIGSNFVSMFQLRAQIGRSWRVKSGRSADLPRTLSERDHTYNQQSQRINRATNPQSHR